MNPKRGEIWTIDFGEPIGHEQAGRRPGLVVSTDLLNDGPAGVVIVIPVTTRRRGLPTHIEIDAGESGLRETSYAKCEDVKSLSVERLKKKRGSVGPDVMYGAERALRYLLDL